MSRFILQNESGQQWPLDGERGVWLSNVQGLGIQNAKSLADIGSGFSLYLDTGTYPNVPIPGDLFFMPPNAYQNYRSFTDFVFSSGECFLLYKPFWEQTYYRRVKVEYITKGVTDKRGRLDCTVSLLPLTPWYSPQAVNLTLQEQDEDAMTYDFTYTDSLKYGSDRAGSYWAEVSAAGHQPAGITVSFPERLSNPIISLVGANSGKTYGRCAINKVIYDGLDYSSQQQDSHVRDGNGQDLMNYISLAEDPYIRIPLGEPCILRIQEDGDITGAVAVSIYSYYRSV